MKENQFKKRLNKNLNSTNVKMDPQSEEVIYILSSVNRSKYCSLIEIRYKKVLLTHFMPLIFFDTPPPRKHQKTSGFLMFSGGIKRHQRHEMG